MSSYAAIPRNDHFPASIFREGRLIAVDAINAPRDFVQSKQLIANRVEIATDRLADSAVALKDLMS